jgi:hypothetical protein
MQLRDRYLQAVRQSLLFMSSARKDDIIEELGDDLRSQMEDREAELGRPLDEIEQEAIFRRCGHPVLVASRYRGGGGSLAFGRVLIGPDIFPYYITLLCLNLMITIGIFLLIDIVALAGGAPVSRVAGWTVRWPGLALPLLAQLVVLTVGFIGVDAWKARWMHNVNVVRTASPGPARWQTMLGIVAWSIALVWWTLVPRYPVLLLGRAAGTLAVGPAWTALYVPFLFLLVAGIVQRVVYLAQPTQALVFSVGTDRAPSRKPDGVAWFHTVMRVAVNLLGLVFLYWPFGSGEFVTAGAGTPDPVHAKHLAQSFNYGVFGWGILSWAWIYLGANLLGHASLAIGYLRRRTSGEARAAPDDHTPAAR